MNRQIARIYGVPMDLGQNRRGVDMGPSAIRYANLQAQLRAAGYDTCDMGNVAVPQAEEKTDDPRNANAHYLPEVAQVCQAAHDQIYHTLQHDEVGIFMGGDHSIAIGTIAAVAAQKGDIGVIWIDAHTDMNTPETSPSGNIHGMALAALLGAGPDALITIGSNRIKIKPENVVVIGVRDVDPEERVRVKASGITVYTMRDIDEQGIGAVVREILSHFERLQTLHVSFDLDSCEPRIAPGVGTPVPGGLTFREAHLLMEMLADSAKVRTMDVVEVNPILDIENRTAKVAVEMIASLFGKRIL
jgi:arginase